MSSIVRNSIFMLLFNIFGRASGLLRYYLLVWFLPPEFFAILTYAFSFSKIGRNFTDGGLDNLISRDGAREPEKVPLFLYHGFILKGMLGSLFCLGGYVYLKLIGNMGWLEILVIYTTLVGSMMLSMTGVLRSAVTAIERMEYVFYTNLPSRLISILIMAIAVFCCLTLSRLSSSVAAWSIYSIAWNWWAGISFLWVAAAVSLENVLWFYLLGYFYMCYFPIRFGFSWKLLRHMVVESWALAIYSFFNVFYLGLDVVMIECLMDMKSVSAYGYASQLIEGITMLLSGYLIAIYPVFSRLYQTDEEAYARLFRRSVIVLETITLPVSVLLGLWSYGWMGLIPNSEPVSGEVLRALAITMNLSIINTLVLTVYTSRNSQKWLVIFTGGAVVISFLLNLTFIPLYGQAGAAYASLFSQALMLWVMGRFASKLFPIHFPIVKLLSILAVSLFAGFTVWMIPGISLLAVPVLYAGVLFATAWLTGVLSLEELRWMLKSIRP